MTGRWWSGAFGAALLLAAGAAAGQGSSLSGGSGTRPRPPSGELPVVVVDEAGKPVAGVVVEGSYPANFGYTASTCCTPVSLGKKVTGRDGVAVLLAPPLTFRAVEITASRKGWPPRTITLDRFAGGETQRDARGRLLLVLGPPRDIAGRVDMGPDCPEGFVEVRGSPPAVRAAVGTNGRFLLRGLAPGNVNISFSACGRTANVIVDAEKARTDPPVLTLPPRAVGRWPYAWPPSSSRPAPAPPPKLATPLPCLAPGPELVVAGDFDTVSLDRSCRFVLAGRQAIVNRSEGYEWTLARPDGTSVRLGYSVRGSSPDVGDELALLALPANERTVEIVEIVTGTRETVGGLTRFELAAKDAVVLATPTRGDRFQSEALTIRWRDGKRQSIAGRAAPGWSLIQDGRVLVYGVMRGPDSEKEVHLFDLTTRVDKKIASGVGQVFMTDEERTLVLSGDERVILYQLAGGARETLAGRGWHVFGRELALKKEKDGVARMRTPAQTVTLPFRWPYVRERVIAGRYLLFGEEGDAIVVDTENGAPRILGNGVQVSDYGPPPISGDWVVLPEPSGRVLAFSLTGQPARALGRGLPRAFSPDGRWLAIIRELPNEITLAPLDRRASAVELRGWGGTFAPDAPAIFFHTADGRFDAPRALYVTYAEKGVTRVLEPRVVSYALGGGEVLAVVPPSSKRPAGIYRRKVASAP